MSKIANLRKGLKPVPVASLEAADKELNKKLGRKSYDQNDDFIQFEDGGNLFRIYPAHGRPDPKNPDEILTVDEHGVPYPFAEAIASTFVPAMYPKKDNDGNIIKKDGLTVMNKSVKMVYSSTIHGKMGADGKPVSVDLIEEFIRLALKYADENFSDKNDREEYLLPIYGKYSNDPAKRVNGVYYSARWVMYVKKIVAGETTIKCGRLDIGKSVKTRINKIAAIELENEPMGTDPFTDLDDGKAVKITYNPDATKSTDYYTTDLDNSTEEIMHDNKKLKVVKTFPITDEELTAFADKDSLVDLYRNAFTRKDFDFQLAGLKMIDDEYDMNIFDTDEFQDIATEIVEHYPVEESTEEENLTEPIPHPAKKVEEPTGDKFDLMDRNELKAFAKENETGLIPKPRSLMSDDDMRDELRIWELSNDVKVEETPEATEEVEKVEEVEVVKEEIPEPVVEKKEEVKEEEPVAIKLTPKQRLEALKAKQAEAK